MQQSTIQFDSHGKKEQMSVRVEWKNYETTPVVQLENGIQYSNENKLLPTTSWMNCAY